MTNDCMVWVKKSGYPPYGVLLYSGVMQHWDTSTPFCLVAERLIPSLLPGIPSQNILWPHYFNLILQTWGLLVGTLLFMSCSYTSGMLIEVFRYQVFLTSRSLGIGYGSKLLTYLCGLCQYSSLILWLFLPSIFDCLQYTKTGGVEGLGTKLSIFQMCTRYKWNYKQSSSLQNNVIIMFWSYAWDTSATSLVDVANHCNTTAFVFVNCITHEYYESHSFHQNMQVIQRNLYCAW